MENLRKILTKLPSNLFTIIVIIAILWLTLAPKPLGDQMPPLFPGADKLAHFMMFGGLSIVLLLDWQRKHSWKKVIFGKSLIVASLSAFLGIIIEFAQESMGLGRGFEYEDILADSAGAFFFALLWFFFQKFWIVTPQN